MTAISRGLERDHYRFRAARHYAVSSMLAYGVPIPQVAAYVGDTRRGPHSPAQSVVRW